MRKQGWGRVVNNTTSYRTMLRVLPYGATKSALESMSAMWAAELVGTGSGWKREQMLRPQIMTQPACWLISDASDSFSGRRITAAEWNITLADDEAARQPSHRLAGTGGSDRLVAGRADLSRPHATLAIAVQRHILIDNQGPPDPTFKG